MPRKPVPIDKIRIDGGTQMRAELHDETVVDYANAMNEGVEFPAIIVFDDGSNHWLADGFHRLHAAKKAGSKSIIADIRVGTKDAAFWFAASANAAHGRPRTQADKRKTLSNVLSHPDSSAMSDREIAKRCCVGRELVAEIRKVIHVGNDKYDRTFTHPKTGKPATMDTAKIGKHAAPVAPPEPEEGQDSGDEAWPVANSAPAQQRPAQAPPTPAKPKAAVDSVGNAIPAHLAGIFAGETLAKIQASIQQARAIIKAATEAGDPELAQAERQRMDIDLKNVWEAVKFARPYAVCMHHKGKACVPCKGTGWLVKTSYDRLVSEQKAGRK